MNFGANLTDKEGNNVVNGQAKAVDDLGRLYEATRDLLAQTDVPAVRQCLRTSLNNLHWALWLMGAEPSFVPDYVSLPDGRQAF